MAIGQPILPPSIQMDVVQNVNTFAKVEATRFIGVKTNDIDRTKESVTLSLSLFCLPVYRFTGFLVSF